MTRRRFAWLALAAIPLLLGLGAIVGVLLLRQGGLAPFRVPTQGDAPRTSPTLVERGAYLARLGNCIGCHTARGGAPLAGGHAFATGYGTITSSNITPDPQHGIGAWSAQEFRHAMRHGVSRHGVLSPVFPYASHLDDDDLDALLAWLRAQPASDVPRITPRLRFPANLPGAMTAWRLLYYRPAPTPRPSDPMLARGAALVQGIGHCGTCHGARGAFASQGAGPQLWGARSGGWHAPALHGEALAHFGEGEIAHYLRGAAPRERGGYGLMADVIATSTHQLSGDDAIAIERWLRALPAPPVLPSPRTVRATAASLRHGETLYREHCADCHGARGEGEAGKYPSLRASRAVTDADPLNLIKLVLFGAVAPSTPLNPRPYTMPPFAQTLSADDVADLVNALRVQHDPEVMPVDASDVRALGGIE